jgi:hypothetical protein
MTTPRQTRNRLSAAIPHYSLLIRPQGRSPAPSQSSLPTPAFPSLSGNRSRFGFKFGLAIFFFPTYLIFSKNYGIMLYMGMLKNVYDISSERSLLTAFFVDGSPLFLPLDNCSRLMIQSPLDANRVAKPALTGLPQQIFDTLVRRSMTVGRPEFLTHAVITGGMTKGCRPLSGGGMMNEG